MKKENKTHFTYVKQLLNQLLSIKLYNHHKSFNFSFEDYDINIINDNPLLKEMFANDLYEKSLHAYQDKKEGYQPPNLDQIPALISIYNTRGENLSKSDLKKLLDKIEQFLSHYYYVTKEYENLLNKQG